LCVRCDRPRSFSGYYVDYFRAGNHSIRHTTATMCKTCYDLAPVRMYLGGETFFDLFELAPLYRTCKLCRCRYMDHFAHTQYDCGAIVQLYEETTESSAWSGPLAGSSDAEE
jgi:hypothetical protein